MSPKAVNAQIARFEEECERLLEMLADFDGERRATRWTPLVGLGLSIPSYWVRPWAPALVLICALVVMGVWRYLIYGHVNERSFQLGKVREELVRLRAGGAIDAAEDPPALSEVTRSFPQRRGVKPLSLFQKR
jgi:hypothetical protein